MGLFRCDVMPQTPPSIAVEMPRPFNATIYEELRSAISIRLRKHHAQGDFMGAMDGFAFLYKALHEAHRIFSGSLATADIVPPTEEKFVRDQAITHFFVNTVSTIDCFAYGAYAFGSWAKPEGFPFWGPEAKKNADRHKTAKLFRKHFPRGPFSKSLGDVVSGHSLKHIADYRNVLIHRAHFRNAITRIGEKPVPALMLGYTTVKPKESGFTQEIEPAFLDGPRKWLDKVCNNLMSDLLRLAQEIPIPKRNLVNHRLRIEVNLPSITSAAPSPSRSSTPARQAA